MTKIKSEKLKLKRQLLSNFMRSNQEFKKELIEKAFIFARKTLVVTYKFPNKRSSWIITDQLLRSATSIGANIIEAQAASSRHDFAKLLNYALKSGNETKFWLSLAKDLDPKLTKDLDELLNECDVLVKILGSSLLTLREGGISKF